MTTLSLSAIFIIFAVCIGTSFGCTCRPSHAQELICDADFVIQGQVLRSSIQGHQRIYKVLVIAKYKCKFGLPIKPGSIIVLSTPISREACGVHLLEGLKYILSGTAIPGGLHIDACGYNRLLFSISRCDFDNIRYGRYQANCGCQVVNCFPPQPFCPRPKCGCVSTRIEHQDSVCVKHHGQRCYWNRFC
uniref:Tissue inhibitor of matrix metalloproteinases 3 n=1 Tax=Tegillarca granosa TaxID=220873 RepID=A0A0D5X252_TEGGR